VTHRSTPVAVSGLSGAVEITTNYFHTCARRASGTVVCWGDNTFGQLGDGTVGILRSTPVAVSGLSDAVEIDAGERHTCARRASGTVVCWGLGDNGQLGDGMMTTRLTPVAVMGL
jgi:alpha-tubulin suppressor-like RCC1 family protein